jgi:hypothetical protein
MVGIRSIYGGKSNMVSRAWAVEKARIADIAVIADIGRKPNTSTY